MKKTAITITGVLLVIVVLFVNASESIQQGYQVGSYVSPFKLPDSNGQEVDISTLKDVKGLIVVFTCNTCPYAKLYEQRIMDLDNMYASKGFPVIAINPNDVSKQPGDSMEEMVKRSQTMGYSFPYLRDDSQEVTRAFGASKTPHIYVLNKEGSGKLRVEYIGAIDDSPSEPADISEKYVEDAVNALLAGKKPLVTTKRAIGCTIKWKES